MTKSEKRKKNAQRKRQAKKEAYAQLSKEAKKLRLSCFISLYLMIFFLILFMIIFFIATMGTVTYIPMQHRMEIAAYVMLGIAGVFTMYIVMVYPIILSCHKKIKAELMAYEDTCTRISEGLLMDDRPDPSLSTEENIQKMTQDMTDSNIRDIPFSTICPSCHQSCPSNAYFCLNCGKQIREKKDESK